MVIRYFRYNLSATWTYIAREGECQVTLGMDQNGSLASPSLEGGTGSGLTCDVGRGWV